MHKVGVIGLGGMGAVHGSKYATMSDVELYCFDLALDRKKTFCERFGAREFGSIDELLTKCDVVDVCLPTDLHLTIGLQAIAAGCAVFMEKPMCLTVADCKTLMDAASKANVPLMPAQVVRYFPEFKKANEQVRNGAVGNPAAIRTRRGGKAPAGVGGWFGDYERSGGILLDLAIHDFDWIRWTFGEVEWVNSRARGVSRKETEDWNGDYALTTMTLASGAIAHVEATWMDPSGFRTTFEICGSEGMIEYDSREQATIRIHEEKGSIAQALNDPSIDPYFLEIRGFLGSISAGVAPPVSAHDGAMAVSIAQAAIKSTQTKAMVRPVQL